MNYMGLQKDQLNQGAGIRLAFFVAGCPFRCKNCQNSEAQDFKAGMPFTDNTVCEIINELNKPYYAGITWLGGEPLAPENINEVYKLSCLIKSKFGETRNQWLYTGYEWDAVKDLKIMENIDVVVCGPYIDELGPINWAGSSNQRVIYLKNGKYDYEQINN